MKLILSFSILFASFLSIAQQKGAFVVQTHINSTSDVISEISLGSIASNASDYDEQNLSLGITGKYHFSDHMATRLEVNYENHKSSSSSEISTGSITENSMFVKQSQYKFSPGIQWNHSIGKINLLGGVMIPIAVRGDQQFYQYNRNADLSGANEQIVRVTTTTPGGYSLGLGCFIGSNYMFHKRFGIGFEISTAYRYLSIGGTAEQTTETSGTTNSISKKEWDSSFEQLKFSPMQGSIRISVVL